MPASESKSEGIGQSIAFSGLLIGSYGLGVVISFPFFLYCAYNSYKLGMLFVGVASILGNVVYALGESPKVIILTRIVCGLEGGVIFMNAVMVQQLTQGDGLLKATAQVIMFPFVGLMLGPITASICQSLAPSARKEVPPSIFMAACGLVFTLAVLAYFPYREQCFAQAYAAGLEASTSNMEGIHETSPHDEVKGKMVKGTDISRYSRRRSTLSVVLLSAVNLSRMVQRLFWEAAALHLLSTNYGLGIEKSGVLLTASLLGLLCLPCVVLPLKRNTGTVGGLRIMDVIEIVGILAMFRIPQFGLDQLVFFMVGSMLFYIGNMGQFSFLVPLRQEHAIAPIWVLSIEGGCFAYSLCQSFGTFLGPVAARDIQETCDGQNIIPAFLLITWCMNWLCKEISVDLLLKRM